MNALIRFSLHNRLLIIALALAALVYGSYVTTQLPIDIFPNLTRPRVVIMTEAPGLAPEEVETLITFPLETAINGAAGVQSVRSSSGQGLSVVYVEFDWNADIYRARQTVAERLAHAQQRLPPGLQPEIAPIASIMGQIIMIGMYSRDDSTSPMEVRTLADWVVRQRLLTIPGVAQVINMGGERKQFQVLVDPAALLRHEVSLEEVKQALGESNQNASGGYLEYGSQEYVIRALGRASTAREIELSVVQPRDERPVLVRDVARVVEAPQVKRGDSSVNGRPAVVISVAKQPEADTRRLTGEILAALRDLQPSLPPDVVFETSIFQQRRFIELGIHNVAEALRDGAALVLVVLFLFLLSFRTTFITLTAIPLSVIITGLVFYWFGLSINVMTLGGIAVAMGELVDDAIVDIENVFRRLRENARRPEPLPILEVVYRASVEIRSSIVYGTLLVVLVFVPLFALSGIEGRLFTPLAIAYIVSILASLLVSLTLTPVLGSLLLPGAKTTHRRGESLVLVTLKRLARPVIALSLSGVGFVAIATAVIVSIVSAGIIVTRLGTDFLPPFDEGSAQVNLYLPPGASLEASNRFSRIFDARLTEHMASPDNPHGMVQSFVRRSGRAEMDEHAEGVNATEYVVTLNPDNPLSRAEQLELLREELAEIPGIVSEVEQPLAHLISHMLSGVTAQIAIKIYGDDLDVLRLKAEEVRRAIADVPGIAPPVVEMQQIVPQLRIELDRERLAHYGLTPGAVNRFIETAMAGEVVSQVLDGQRTFDLLVRLDDTYRGDLNEIGRLTVDLPGGGRIALASVANIYEGGGPNTINRENVRRRITVRANAGERDLGSTVADIQQRIASRVTMPEGYFVEYGGQFQAQQEAMRLIGLLSTVALVGIFLVLYTLLGSLKLVLQVMIALPIAYVGGALALWLTGQTLSIASLVGFISLSGIAARNGILLVMHYLHLMRNEGEPFAPSMIIRGSLERLAPVLMTALTTGIALIPLLWHGLAPGKEILYPVATVILGGLVTSTACEFLVRPGLFWRFSPRQLVDQSCVTSP